MYECHLSRRERERFCMDSWMTFAICLELTLCTSPFSFLPCVSFSYRFVIRRCGNEVLKCRPSRMSIEATLLDEVCFVSSLCLFVFYLQIWCWTEIRKEEDEEKKKTRCELSVFLLYLFIHVHYLLLLLLNADAPFQINLCTHTHTK